MFAPEKKSRSVAILEIEAGQHLAGKIEGNLGRRVAESTQCGSWCNTSQTRLCSCTVAMQANQHTVYSTFQGLHVK